MLKVKHKIVTKLLNLRAGPQVDRSLLIDLRPRSRGNRCNPHRQSMRSGLPLSSHNTHTELPSGIHVWRTIRLGCSLRGCRFRDRIHIQRKFSCYPSSAVPSVATSVGVKALVFVIAPIVVVVFFVVVIAIQIQFKIFHLEILLLFLTHILYHTCASLSSFFLA